MHKIIINLGVAAHEYSNVVGERFWRDYSSNNYELSENAIKMMFFLISGQKIIMKGCA